MIYTSSVAECALGVQLSAVATEAVDGGMPNLGAPFALPDLDGDVNGLLCRRGEGDAGDSGRLNGELRGVP